VLALETQTDLKATVHLGDHCGLADTILPSESSFSLHYQNGFEIGIPGCTTKHRSLESGLQKG
jgi:hypothetical protein